MGSIMVHFLKNTECQEAYKAYFCYLNFPRCDAAQNSLLMCDSACKSFFRACRYPYSSNANESMWRCGPAAYYGSDEGETYLTLDTKGLPIFHRAPFPGLPFASNAPDACTPGVPGGAAGAALSGAVAALAVAALLAQAWGA